MDDSIERFWAKFQNQQRDTKKNINWEKIIWITSDVKALLEDYSADNEASCEMVINFDKIIFTIIGTNFEILGFEKYIKEIIGIADFINISSTPQCKIILEIGFTSWEHCQYTKGKYLII